MALKRSLYSGSFQEYPLIFLIWVITLSTFDGLLNCVVPENIHTPPTEGIFHMTPPPPLWIFQKRPANYTPPPLRKFQFFPTPPGNISISCLKRKIS